MLIVNKILEPIEGSRNKHIIYSLDCYLIAFIYQCTI